MADLIGQTVAGYPIEKLLGSSSYRVVVQAKTSAEPVAILLLREDLRGDRTLNEAIAASWEKTRAVAHEGLLSPMACGVDPAHGAYSLVQLLKVKTLRQIVKSGMRITGQDAAELATQIANGLKALHAVDLVHGDLQPSNVLITLDMDVRLEGAGTLGQIPRQVTELVRGPDFGFIAPERLQGAAASPGSDWYGLGGCLYYMFVGQDPFPMPDQAAFEARFLDRAVPPLATERPELSAEWTEFLARLWAKDPTQRYGNAADVLADLEALKKKKPLAPLKGGPPATFPQKAAPSPTGSGSDWSEEKRADAQGTQAQSRPSGISGQPAARAKIFGKLQTHVGSTIPQSDREKQGDELYQRKQLSEALEAWREAWEAGPQHFGLKVKLDLGAKVLKHEQYELARSGYQDSLAAGDFTVAIKYAQEARESSETDPQRAEATRWEEDARNLAAKAVKSREVRKMIAACVGIVVLVVVVLLWWVLKGS